VPNAPNAKTSTGATPKSQQLVETQSKCSQLDKHGSCLGQYTFINDGVGKGEKITFAEAWQGKWHHKI
jgi:hypothetical protein